MAELPSKRRRLSLDAYRSTNGDVEGHSADPSPNPTTPSRRASYLSPTKASLARSHPNILAKSPKRGSLTEPRGRLLRQELLGSRNDGTESITKPILRTTEDASVQRVGNDENLKENDFATAIAQSFRATPEQQMASAMQSQPNQRSPLRDRQPPSNVPPTRSSAANTDPRSFETVPTPKLVRRPDALRRQPSEPGDEPALPPTPVQLGINAAFERPRGLPSSSSMGSKSGSGRHRRRIRHGDGHAITSSPLKPKHRGPVSPADFSDLEEPEIDIPKETQSEAAKKVDMHNLAQLQRDIIPNRGAMLPPALRVKQADLTKLRSEAEKLRSDLNRLEALTDKLKDNALPRLAEADVELLDLGSTGPATSFQAPELHPTFIKNPSPYLNLFASGNLQLRHETTTESVQKRPKVVHKLTFAAPEPWPAHILSLSFKVETDAEDACVESVAEVKSGNTWEYGNLRHWINNRLQNPLHQFDIGGVTWGIGQYFEASAARAKIFRDIDEEYNQKVPHKMFERVNLAVRDTLMLSQYLHETQLLITCGDSQGVSKQVLLDYAIDLTWTGDTVRRVNISFQGVNGKAQKGAKELFQRLLLINDVVGAFDAVWNLMGFGRGSEEGVVTEKTRRARVRRSISAY